MEGSFTERTTLHLRAAKALPDRAVPGAQEEHVAFQKKKHNFITIVSLP